MLTKSINITGLIFDIGGALLMFKNTPHPTKEPPPHPSDIGRIASWYTYGRVIEAKQQKMNNIGIILLCMGFVLQGLA
jgi:hypothetical protein